MNAIDFNRNRRQRGMFSDIELEQLVRYFQWTRGLRGDDFDGKFGDGSELELRKALDELAPAWGAAAPDVDTTPDVTKPFEGWIYPMPPFVDVKGTFGDAGKIYLPQITSTYSKNGSGPNTDRANHWGVDIMYKKAPTGRASATEDQYGNFCPLGITVLAAGPGTIYAVAPGNVLIDHHEVKGFGPVTTWYQHMNEALVQVGDKVLAGDPIGIAGTVYTDLRHLHFELRDHRRGASRALATIDPEPIINRFKKAS